MKDIKEIYVYEIPDKTRYVNRGIRELFLSDDKIWGLALYHISPTIRKNTRPNKLFCYSPKTEKLNIFEDLGTQLLDIAVGQQNVAIADAHDGLFRTESIFMSVLWMRGNPLFTSTKWIQKFEICQRQD